MPISDHWARGVLFTADPTKYQPRVPGVLRSTVISPIKAAVAGIVAKLAVARLLDFKTILPLLVSLPLAKKLNIPLPEAAVGCTCRLAPEPTTTPATDVLAISMFDRITVPVMVCKPVPFSTSLPRPAADALPTPDTLPFTLYWPEFMFNIELPANTSVALLTVPAIAGWFGVLPGITTGDAADGTPIGVQFSGVFQFVLIDPFQVEAHPPACTVKAPASAPMSDGVRPERVWPSKSTVTAAMFMPVPSTRVGMGEA